MRGPGKLRVCVGDTSQPGPKWECVCAHAQRVVQAELGLCVHDQVPGARVALGRRNDDSMHWGV